MTSQFVNIHTHRPTGRGHRAPHRRHPPVGCRQRGHRRTRHAPGGRTGHRRDGARLCPRRRAPAATGRLPRPAGTGARPATARSAALRQGLRARHAGTGRPRAPCRHIPRVHRLARAGTPRTGERLLPLVRRADVLVAQDPGSAARNAPGQLFLETDDSDTGIEEVYAHAAAVRGTTVEALKRATTENYERIFAPQNG